MDAMGAFDFLFMNPFREFLVSRSSPQPCTIVIFGATGDLTHRKLVPALYNIALDGDLPPGSRIVGFARREKTHDQFRQELEAANRQFSRQGHDEEVWRRFAQSIFYHQSEFQDPAGYERLAHFLNEVETSDQGTRNRLFYMASAPEYFDDILLQLRAAGLNQAPEGHWARVVVEKPFGSDLSSARHLNDVVNATFAEESTYRIDHYLGKETAQNIMVLRFANAIFEPLWNSRHVDHVQITCAEQLGMEGGRGAYYDKAGALRDMVQNHLLQLLSLTAMEPPTDLTADRVRDEKVKVLRSLRPLMGPTMVSENVVRAQYTAGANLGESVRSYRDEERVNPQSLTEAYVALRLQIDNWRWEGVPFYMRVGKRLPKRTTEISIHFKEPPGVLFHRYPVTSRQNVLAVRIQPDEGISLRMLSKVPGPSVRMEPVKMDFHYHNSFGRGSPEAYERLLLDAMAGDATLFARRDEVETAWGFVDEIEKAWHESPNPPPMTFYEAGSWGPEEADALLGRDGRVWRRL